MNLKEQFKGKQFPFVRFSPNVMDLERAMKLEWIIPNNLGGYSSSTILGLNTRRTHGLLVSSCKNLKRILYLNRVDEIIISNEEYISLLTEKNTKGEINGYKYLTEFEFNYNSVSFHYDTEFARFVKRINPLKDKNAILILYKIKNKLLQSVRFQINLLTTSRNIHDLRREDSLRFEPRLFSKNIMGVKSENGYIAFYSDKAVCSIRDGWRRDVVYLKEKEIGRDYSEDIYSPGYFSMEVKPNRTENFMILVIGYDTEEKTANAFKEILKSHESRYRMLSNAPGTSILTLLTTAETFVVDRNAKKSIIAGYPELGERGREAMISLPGLTMINGRFDDTERILEHWLNNATSKGIPSEFVNGKPVYKDIDTSLWMINSLYEYVKYVGVERGKNLLHTYWWTLKDIIKHYSEMERDGLLIHNSGTWMRDQKRDSTVEVQGLWYNALRIMEKFAEIMDDDIDIEYSCRRFEENFLSKFWTGSYLADSLEDNSLRPNQLIPLSLEFNVIDAHTGKKVLNAIEKSLLTKFGLRTLSPDDPRYSGDSRYNGGVWPWLLGPYIKAYIRYNRRLHAQKILEPLFEIHTRDAGLGTISEFFNGDPPHNPMGCISYSCSVGEVLRAYFEDIMGKRARAL